MNCNFEGKHSDACDCAPQGTPLFKRPQILSGECEKRRGQPYRKEKAYTLFVNLCNCSKCIICCCRPSGLEDVMEIILPVMRNLNAPPSSVSFKYLCLQAAGAAALFLLHAAACVGEGRLRDAWGHRAFGCVCQVPFQPHRWLFAFCRRTLMGNITHCPPRNHCEQFAASWFQYQALPKSFWVVSLASVFGVREAFGFRCSETSC